MIKVKRFQELTAAEVYEILKARCDVFTVEQKICYPDMDDIDYEALHVWCEDERGMVQAYLRLYREPCSTAVHMGRVLTREHGRGQGRELVSEGVRVAREMMGATQIELHSQQYCTVFYEKLGFRAVSPVFIEADIPHVSMVMNL